MPRLAVVLVALAFAAAAVVCQAADGSNYKAPQVLLQGRFEPGPRSESSTGDLPQVRSLPKCTLGGRTLYALVAEGLSLRGKDLRIVQMQSAEELQQYVAAMHLIPLWPLDGSVEEAVVKARAAMLFSVFSLPLNTHTPPSPATCFNFPMHAVHDVACQLCHGAFHQY